jgi:transcriptional regulator with XRE-family HTH domain
MELGNRSGLNFTEISRLERAERDPQLQTILKVARGLGVGPARLFEGVETEARD